MAGDADAQLKVGKMYARGEGVPVDEAQAVHWYRLAAEQGNPDAQFDLAASYRNGEGVAEDDAEAVRWFRMAAEQGSLTHSSVSARGTPMGRE